MASWSLFAILLLTFTKGILSSKYVGVELFESLAAEVATLKSDRVNHESRISDLESRLQTTQNGLARAETKIMELEIIIDNGESAFETMEMKNNLDTEKNNSFDIDVSSIGSVMSSQVLSDGTGQTVTKRKWRGQPKSQTETAQKDLKTKRFLDDGSTARARSVFSRVAFSAYMSDSVSNLGAYQPLPFDRVLMNYGNHFSTNSHYFLCPVTGVYVFQSSIMANSHDTVQTQIVRGGAKLANMYAGGSATGNGFDQGFNSVISPCNGGEKVWVQLNDNAIPGNAAFGFQYTTFSGYLLWQS